LVRTQDPFAKLLVHSAGVMVSTREILAVREAGWDPWGMRFENMVAVELLRAVSISRDRPY